MADKINPIREADESARALARQLARTARHGALAVVDENGHPLVSRVLIAMDFTGQPLILASELSAHTKAIELNNKVSLLLGEPKKGDPVAHPRISIQGDVGKLLKAEQEYKNARSRFLHKHPKSALYIDFADFQIFKLNIKSANLNGGFGKAFHLSPGDLTTPNSDLANHEADIIEKLNSDHADLAGNLASLEGAWKVIAIDLLGIEFAKGDQVERKEFEQPLNETDDPKNAVKMIASFGA